MAIPSLASRADSFVTRRAVATVGSRRQSLVNDVHSQLNRTRVAEVIRPATVAELQAAVRRARHDGLSLSMCGGRHSMGGQQFCSGALLVDLTCLKRVIDLDA